MNPEREPQPGSAAGSARGWFQPRSILLPASALLFLVAGLALRLSGHAIAAWAVWTVGLLFTGLPVASRTLAAALRGRFAADLVAALAILGALFLDQPLAGLVVVLMQTGGEALERYAEGRASRAVRELEAAAPRVAHRWVGTMVEDIAADAILVGDRLLVRPGEMLPCDAEVVEGRSDVDTSRLTGEALPCRAEAGVHLPSGSVNGDGSLTVRAVAVAGESQYARIVELVRSAQASKTPLQRLADRYAVWFTPLTLGVCVVAWLISRNPDRVLAVLVVATPCPLILATPVAIVGGLNRAARRQIIFRHGTALEQLGSVTFGVFDKTGTLTVGRPRVAHISPVPPFTEIEVLRFAAAVEQASGHLLARTIVEEALRRLVPLGRAYHVVESPGQGIEGEVDGRAVAVGGWSFIVGRHPKTDTDLAPVASGGSGLRAYVAVEGRGAGSLEFADEIRPGMHEFLARLRDFGVRRTLLLSGDNQANADAVARAVGLDAAKGDLLPADKLAYVQRLTKQGERVLMVGDGTNDAPALSMATVGIALAAHGGGVTAEAADAVVLADDPARIAEAVAISRDTMRIARQSIGVGLSLSAVAMGLAAAGFIPPVLGAALQELIDVGVIVNALRAAGPGVGKAQ
jgi:heavy metal translocating P-type ATPase